MCECVTLFGLEMVENIHDHPIGFAQGDIIWKRDKTMIYRCANCHEYYGEAIATLDEEIEDAKI